MVRALHLDLTGRHVASSGITANRHWLDERSDLVTALRMATEGSLEVGAWAHSRYESPEMGL